MNILLGVTGSVAATLTTKLCRELKQVGDVKVIMTNSAQYFALDYQLFDLLDDAGTGSRKIWLDEHEWKPNVKYQKNQDIPHITLGNWADVFVIAPLTLNTMSKMFFGLADNLLTCTYAAWDYGKPVIIAPAMNTRMWENNGSRTMEALWKRHQNIGKAVLHYIAPVKKELACGEVGIGGLADIKDIVDKVKYVLHT